MKLSKGLEWLIKEQRLTPKPKRQPIDQDLTVTFVTDGLEEPESIGTLEGSTLIGALEESMLTEDRMPYQITVTGQSVQVVYKRPRKERRGHAS